MKRILKIMLLLTIIQLQQSIKAWCQNAARKHQDNSIRIKVNYPESLPGDTLFLQATSDVKKITTDPKRLTWLSYKAVRQSDGRFFFVVKQPQLQIKSDIYTYVYLTMATATGSDRKDDAQNQKITEMLPYYCFKSGEDVTMTIKDIIKPESTHGYRHNFKYNFTGTGSLLQNLWYKIDSIAYNTTTNVFISEGGAYNDSNYENVIANDIEKYLNDYKSSLRADDYYQLLTHGIFSAKTDEAVLIRHLKKTTFLNYGQIEKQRFLLDYDGSFNFYESKIPQPLLQRSYDYLQAQLYRFALHATVANPQNFVDSLYSTIKSQSIGELREKLLVLYFSKYRYEVKDMPLQLEDALTFIKTPLYHQFLIDGQRITPGSIAYNFDLPGTDGKHIKLSDFKGKVVLMDFWFTGCGNCQLFYKNALSAVEKKFEKDSSVVFVAVSIDMSKKLWLQSVKAGVYTSSDVYNLFTNGEGQSAQIIRYYQVHGFPQPILIGKDQKIKICDDSLRSETYLKAAILKEKMN